MTRAEEILRELRRIGDGIETLIDGQLRGPKVSLTLTQAAKALGVQRGRLGHLVTAGRIAAIREGRGGKRIKIARSEVERLAREGLPPEPTRRGRPRKPVGPQPLALVRPMPPRAD